jgi:gamma-glutamyltranspeptidase/glutathione hydrolase
LKVKVPLLLEVVPGTIAGLFAVHEKLGLVTIAEILAPVIALAENGVVISELQANSLAHYQVSNQN